VRSFRSRLAFGCSLNWSDHTSCFNKRRVTIKKSLARFLILFFVQFLMHPFLYVKKKWKNLITKLDVSKVTRVSRVFEETRKEINFSLTFTHSVWILETGVTGCESNFSAFSELKLAIFMQKILRIEENRLIIFS
jgi:hypothetical protein